MAARKKSKKPKPIRLAANGSTVINVFCEIDHDAGEGGDGIYDNTIEKDESSGVFRCAGCGEEYPEEWVRQQQKPVRY